MKKNYDLRIVAALTLAAFALSACGSSVAGEALTNESINAPAVPEGAAETDTDDIAEKADTDSTGEADTDDMAEKADTDDVAEKADTDKAVKEEEPSSLYFLSEKMSIEDMVNTYAVNMASPGYTGDIGDVISAYKGVDLDGDQIEDIIERFGDDTAGYGYLIDFSGGGSIRTGTYSSVPNEGEVIEFYDLDGDHIDEILIAHFTFSTGGAFCWQTGLYVKDDSGVWKCFPLIDENDGLYCEGLKEMIRERSGISFDEQIIRFADVELVDEGIAMLADFGQKNGPEQVLDYEGAILEPDIPAIKNGKASETDAFKFKGSSKDCVEKFWPIGEENYDE